MFCSNLEDIYNISHVSLKKIHENLLVTTLSPRNSFQLEWILVFFKLAKPNFYNGLHQKEDVFN